MPERTPRTRAVDVGGFEELLGQCVEVDLQQVDRERQAHRRVRDDERPARVGDRKASEQGRLGDEVRLQRQPLAGFRYAEANEVWPHLATGDALELVREPDNPHDANAVRVEWRGRKLGYVPRRENAALAWAMDRGEALRLKGPPQESIRLDVDIDATDQLERGDGLATTFGIAPTLASLEMLLYPKSALVIANEVLLNLGILEIIPPEAPLTLFVWGLKRVLPVRLTDLSITEEFFDPDLNPIRAKATLSLRVLTYQDLGLLSVGGTIPRSRPIRLMAISTAPDEPSRLPK